MGDGEEIPTGVKDKFRQDLRLQIKSKKSQKRKLSKEIKELGRVENRFKQ